MESMLATVLTSAAVSALVTATATWWMAERRIAIENVTQERAKWRAAVRDEAAHIVEYSLAGDADALLRSRAALRLLLNPLDREDQGILECSLALRETSSEQTEEFGIRVSLLLKHDWERSKHETRKLRIGKRPKRIAYEALPPPN